MSYHPISSSTCINFSCKLKQIKLSWKSWCIQTYLNIMRICSAIMTHIVFINLSNQFSFLSFYLSGKANVRLSRSLFSILCSPFTYWQISLIRFCIQIQQQQLYLYSVKTRKGKLFPHLQRLEWGIRFVYDRDLHGLKKRILCCPDSKSFCNALVK